jgi:hypothetical protein
MFGPQHSSTRSPVRSGARPLNVLWLLLPMACLPQDDLESYSRAWQSRPAPTSPDAAAPGDEPSADASVADGDASGSGGGSPGSGGSGGALVDGGDAGLLVVDAGVEPDEPDASAGADLDAGAADAAAP